MTLQRTETPTRFKTNVTRQLVQAMRDTMQSNLFQTDFPTGINVVNVYPLTEVQYPAVIVTFLPTNNETAGIGHEEVFNDINGQPRTWQHRRFEGTVSFTAVALDPIDRDVLSDAVVDALSFSHFTDSPALAAFFTRMQQTPDAIGTVFQVNLTSDRIIPGGTSVSIAPWQPEDVLLYEEVWSVAVMGGYYNTVLSEWPGYIMDAYIDDPFMQSFAADPPLVPPDITPSVQQAGRGFEKASITKTHVNESVFDGDNGTGVDLSVIVGTQSRTDTGAASDSHTVLGTYLRAEVNVLGDSSVLVTGNAFHVSDSARGIDTSSVIYSPLLSGRLSESGLGEFTLGQ